MAFSSASAPVGSHPAQLRLFRQVLFALVVLAAVLVAVAGSPDTPGAAGARSVSATVDAPTAPSPALR